MTTPPAVPYFVSLTTDEAEAVYDVLVETVGASESWRLDFVFHQTDRVASEHRIIGGALGQGGKFRRNVGYRGYGDGSWGQMWWVDAYPEDLPDNDLGRSRRAMIEAANEKLNDLRIAHEAAQEA